MPTVQGPSTIDKLLDTWLGFQRIKHSSDLETLDSARNIPDRVAVAAGETESSNGGAAGVASLNPLILIGLTVAAVAAVVLLARN